MGALAASIAHDFNNVLGKVQILVSHARSETESDPDSPLYSDLSQIEDHVDDASRLVSNLLSLKESVIANSATRHVETLRQVASGVKRIVPANVAYDYSIADDLPDVWLTDIALKRIVDNLVKNSLDAMPYGGKLTVTAERRNVETQAGHDALPADEYLVLDVRDTGVGMSPEVLENVFEPFYSTKKEGRGSGLGLWTVYKIVRQAGGYVNVKSKPERGTEISCYLRRSPPPVRQGAG
jgi:two-component system cell cycle sensor histidine kinase/response regulator CckA